MYDIFVLFEHFLYSYPAESYFNSFFIITFYFQNSLAKFYVVAVSILFFKVLILILSVGLAPKCPVHNFFKKPQRKLNGLIDLY